MKALFNEIRREKNIHSFALQIVSAIVGFASFIILARYLDKHSFGLWVLYITAYGFLDLIRSGLTQTAVVRFLSGAKNEERDSIIGSNWILNVIIAVSLSIIVFAIYKIFNNSISESDYCLFFKYFPIMVIVNFPLLSSMTLLQAFQRFDIMLYIRLIEGGLFVIFLLINYIWLKFQVETIIIVQIIIIALVSISCQILGFDGIRKWKKVNKQSINKIFAFGKYSTGSMIGSNLLKSSDTFIIGLSTVLGLGANGVAIYSIPLKMIEIIEVPLRSFSLTLFPNLSKSSIENKIDDFKTSFYAHTGALTILFIPILFLCYIFSNDLMILVGGKDYHSSGLIFRIFILYALMLPLARFSGIALDSLNKPNKNFIKIMFMVTANIIGDIIAVFVFKSMIGVAIVTVIFSLLGIILGYYFLNKEISLEFKRFFSEGFRFYINYYKHLRTLLKSD